jgi:hypothetical protein
MPGLTMTEKEFWKTRSAARIGRRIEAIHARRLALFDRFNREAHGRALRSLGFAEAYAELEAIRAEEEAPADDPIGREIARREAERENLLDTVRLATSPTAIKQQWTKVGALLGDEPSALEREAPAIAPIDEP